MADITENGTAIKDVERLADILMSLQRCFILRLSEGLSQGQISFPQYFLLAHIATQESLSMSEVAERMNHSTAAATGLVDRLENLNYVQRMHAANDRRKVLVKITKKGLALVNHMREDMVVRLNVIMDLLPPEEQKAWLRIYEKINTYCQTKQQSTCDQ
jgi:DNA-binding MarR family transcriptional regulator